MCNVKYKCMESGPVLGSEYEMEMIQWVRNAQGGALYRIEF